MKGASLPDHPTWSKRIGSVGWATFTLRPVRRLVPGLHRDCPGIEALCATCGNLGDAIHRPKELEA